jgi:hypothetical protein
MTWSYEGRDEVSKTEGFHRSNRSAEKRRGKRALEGEEKGRGRSLGAISWCLKSL